MRTDWLVLLFCALAALAIGSFLNVLIYRLPLILQSKWNNEAKFILNSETNLPQNPFNLLFPRSHCATCKRPIRYREIIPIISWILLGGKCKGCSTAIPIRYLAVELLSLIAFFIALGVWGYSYAAILHLVFLWALIALAFIDYETHLLPDEITQPILWLGLVAAWIFNAQPYFPPLHDALAGAVLAYLSMWMIYWGFKLITGKEGLGHGDFKLFAVLGAWLGWQVLPEVALIAACLGLVFVIFLRLLAKVKISVVQIGPAIPFGPFLSAAGCVTLLRGHIV